MKWNQPSIYDFSFFFNPKLATLSINFRSIFVFQLSKYFRHSLQKKNGDAALSTCLPTILQAIIIQSLDSLRKKSASHPKRCVRNLFQLSVRMKMQAWEKVACFFKVGIFLFLVANILSSECTTWWYWKNLQKAFGTWPYRNPKDLGPPLHPWKNRSKKMFFLQSSSW